MDRVLVEQLEDAIRVQLQNADVGGARRRSHEHLQQLVLDQQRYGLQDVVPRLADRLVQRVNDGLVLHHDFRRRL